MNFRPYALHTRIEEWETLFGLYLQISLCIFCLYVKASINYNLVHLSLKITSISYDLSVLSDKKDALRLPT